MKIENFSKSFSDVKVCYGNRFSDDRGFLIKNFFGNEFKFLLTPKGMRNLPFIINQNVLWQKNK